MSLKVFSPDTLCAKGWTRRSVASEPRLSEAVELYRSLGLEVLLVPVLQELCGPGGEEGCGECFDATEAPDRHQVIYTRPCAGGGGRK